MVKKILISQPQPSSDKSPYYDIAKEFGVQLDFRPRLREYPRRSSVSKR